MKGLAFLDTNVVVYTDDAASLCKQPRAIRLITEHQRAGTLVISLQVMQEYFAAATRKLGVDADLAQQKVQLLARGRVVRFNTEDVIAAIELHRLNTVPFWDAMIIHAARVSGAETLYSEDLQTGSRYGRVRVVNPFAEP